MPIMLPEPDQAPPIVSEVIASEGQPLTDERRAYFEPRLGADLSEVRLHDDEQAARSADAVNARAYAVGRDVVVGRGAPALDSVEGRKLLAHELAHVVQQDGAPGPGAPMAIGGVADPAERDAEAVADRVVTGPAIGDRERAQVPARGATAALRRAPQPLPSGAPIFELSIDPQAIIHELWSLSQSSWRTRVVDWNTHTLSSQIRKICGSNYFRGANYWASDWEDDEFNDVWDLGVVDTDIQVELTLMIDNLKQVTTGEGEFKSGGDTEEKKTKSSETTLSGDIGGKAGDEKKGGVEGKVGAEHKSGSETEMSVKGSGDVTMKMGATVYKADAYMQVTLNYNPTFYARGHMGPSTVYVGSVTYGAPGGTPTKPPGGKE